jgi:small subunit ribosomal protein S15
MAIKEIQEMPKQTLVEKFARGPKDTGSAEVQIAVISQRIKKLEKHFTAFKKDNTGKRGLLRLIGQRKRLLKYLEKTSNERYRALVKELGLRVAASTQNTEHK